MNRLLSYLILILFSALQGILAANPSRFTLTGRVMEESTLRPLAYANVRAGETGLSILTDSEGNFKLNNAPEGKVEIEVTLMGYQPLKKVVEINGDLDLKDLVLQEESLNLPDIEVTAQRNTRSGASSYVMDRSVLDHAQVINLSDIMSLLPGGQTVNSTLMDDSRMALRSGSGEAGNASFGTAVEIDGIRLDNNANMDETQASSTRNVSASNIGSVEVISGVPSVEYGDVSNGIVKVNPRSGASPWILEASINPYSRQAAINKGLNLKGNGGILNFSFDHAQSFSNIASPHTSYRRNSLSASYLNTFWLPSSTLKLNAAIYGNIGGYKLESNPDAFRDTYQKVRDNQVRGTFKLDWLHSGEKGVFRVNAQASVAYTDKFTETNTNESSASTQAALHTMTSGYAIAENYDDSLGVGDIILGPTGYWYVKSYNDQKPLSIQSKLKGSWTLEISRLINMVTLGTEFNSSSNKGKGVYYDDMALAPTWRPYDYSLLPALNTLAFFLEDKLTWSRLTLTAGLRSDITFIKGSDYGTAFTLSPRANASFNIFRTEKNQINLQGGVGKGVKLPSFQVLYPAAGYSDRLVFTPGSTADNKAYYAYYTHVSEYIYNKELKWQSTLQADLGIDGRFDWFSFSVTGFFNHTQNPYQLINIFTPFTYNYTSQEALENCPIPSEQRKYTIDPTSGIVSVTSLADGSVIQLPYSERNTYIVNQKYVNGSPVNRYGLEWIADMTITGKSHPVGLSLRIDGSYYHYKGLNTILVAGTPSGVGDYAADSGIKPLIGYYAGCNVTSASSASTPSASTGSFSKGCSVNTTLTMRIPKIQLIMTLRLESTFLNYKRNLTDSRYAVMLEAAGDISGKPYDGSPDTYVAYYPVFYSTWDNPDERIPFAESLAAAKENNPELYRQLCNLIVRTNTSYYFNPQNISAYFSVNFSITKEIGKWVSLSVYANNFFNNMSFVRNSQTGLESSLFGSGYIPKFYYGIALRIKI